MTRIIGVVLLLVLLCSCSRRWLLCREMDVDQCETLQKSLQRASVGPMQPVFRGMQNGPEKD